MTNEQSKQCKIEFYFTREKIEQLLKANPHAKGIIISQEIKVRRTAENGTLNVVEIKARADNGAQKGGSSIQAVSKTASDEVDGCPNPPGCGPETPDEP